MVFSIDVKLLQGRVSGGHNKLFKSGLVAFKNEAPPFFPQISRLSKMCILNGMIGSNYKHPSSV
jgi:hypothetical protein